VVAPRVGLGARWAALRANPRLAALLRGAGGFFAVQVAGTGLAFLAQVLLARLLGAAAYGDYVVAYGWVALLAVPASAGHGTAALRFVAQYLGAQDWPRLRGYVQVAIASAAGVAGVAALALVVSAQSSAAASGLSGALAVGALVVPLQTALVLTAAILRGLHWPAASQAPASLVQPLVLIAWALFSVTTAAPLSGRSAMAWTALASLAALVCALGLVARAAPLELRNVTAVRETAAWQRVALPLFWITLLNVAMQRVDVLIVGAQLGTESAGIYAAASRLALLVSFGLVAVNAWAAPSIADLHARGERDELQRTVRTAARVNTAFTLPVSLAIALLAPPLLGLFGAGFAAGRDALWILCVGQIVNALLGPVGYLMTMTGNQAEAARVLSVAALANVLACVVLTPRFGLAGAAAGTAFAQVIWNVWMSVLVWRRLGVRATVF
jgi:O-antigen/teichoic acid export membrane protein